ncbi:MAG: hypothetical protein PHE56_00285 [Bacteroidales bacterium]|nr:hypothetical protein [Bacteroidales bacterium]
MSKTNDPNRKKKVEEYVRLSKEIAEGKNIIPGIYNYCDRWCERCRFTHNCSVAIMESETGPDSEVGWDATMDYLSITFEAIGEMLRESAAEFGIDLDNLPEVEREVHVPGELEIESRELGIKMMKWFKANHDYLNEVIEKAFVVNQDNAAIIKEALTIVEFYCLFISAKIHRASRQNTYNLTDDDGNPFPKDSDGSAKIALLAIDKMLESFKALYSFLPEKEDDVLHFLAVLSKLKRGMLEKFPDAMAFKRPGFDD